MRNQGVELLRLLLMFLIVFEHVIGHGAGAVASVLQRSPDIDSAKNLLLFYAPCIMAVDCFVFISGYYGIRFNIKKAISFILQTSSTAFIILIIGLLSGKISSLRSVVTLLFPLISNCWWFISTYMILMCLSPLLNEFKDKLSRREQTIILIILFLLESFGGVLFNTVNANFGYSVVNFIFIYLSAQYISDLKILNSNKINIPVFLGVNIVILLLVYFFADLGQVSLKRIFSYNNPLVLLSATALFGIFKNLNINFSFSKLSCYAFGIYLFTENDVFRPMLTPAYNNFGLILTALIFYSGGMIAEIFRYNFMKMIKLEDRILKVLKLI